MSAKTQTAKATVKGQPETDYNGVTVYSVPSRTQDGVTYQVVERDGHIECCCTAAQFGRHCCHIAAVNEFKWKLAAAAKRDSAPLYHSNAPFQLIQSQLVVTTSGVVRPDGLASSRR
jgi:hypothetical protein